MILFYQLCFSSWKIVLLLPTASGWHLVQSTHPGSIHVSKMCDSKVLSLQTQSCWLRLSSRRCSACCFSFLSHMHAFSEILLGCRPLSISCQIYCTAHTVLTSELLLGQQRKGRSIDVVEDFLGQNHLKTEWTFLQMNTIFPEIYFLVLPGRWKFGCCWEKDCGLPAILLWEAMAHSPHSRMFL